jgi:hypothetical protein
MPEEIIILMPLMHYIMNASSITHFMNKDINRNTYKELEFLYNVSITRKDSNGNKIIVAGFITKSSGNHEHAKFLDSIDGYIQQLPDLKLQIDSTTTYMPAKINVSDDHFLTEKELLSIVMNQMFKHSTAGRA